MHPLYKIHYFVRRGLNFLLLLTWRRLRHGKAIFAHGPLLSNFSYSGASLDFVHAELGGMILSHVSGLDENSIVVDVGGETGIWATQIYDRYAPHLKIFEPHPEFVKVLQERFKDRKAEIFPFGLGSTNQACLLSDAGMGSSVYSASLSYKVSQKFEITIRDVKEVFDELDFADIDLLKVNIEGGEYELLPRLIETGLVSRCRIIRIQFHEWIPNAFAMRRKIVNDLAKTHDVEWSYPLVWESWIRR